MCLLSFAHMLNLWIIATLISTFFWGIASMLMKKVSNEYNDNYLALVYQYSAMAIAALSIGARWAISHGSAYLPTLDMKERWLVIAIGIIWYLGIMFLFKAYDKLSAWVALVIANLATFLMYFANLALYPGQEAFTLVKMILAVVFFVIISQFLLDQWGNKSVTRTSLINPATLYPLATAVCRSLYFVGNSYFIKSGIMSPVQSGMLTETCILVVAIIWFLCHHTRDGLARIRTWISRRTAPIFLGIGFLNTCAVYLMYYGYQTNPANIVNVIRLFAIPLTVLACWIFLRERLTKKQTILLVCACLVMMWFMAF